MADYQLTATDAVVIRTEDNASVPNDPANRDWVEYQAWLADGGVPDPYVPPPESEPSVAPETALLYEHENRLLALEGKPPTNVRDFVKKVKRGMILSGKVSWFGGPDDEGVDPDEDLAFIFDVDDAPHLFLPEQPEGTTGLARRLDPKAYYIACRWDYDVFSEESLLENVALVHAPKTGKQRVASPADWGPHEDTGRVADISPGLMETLGIETDDEIEMLYPFQPNEEGEDV